MRSDTTNAATTDPPKFSRKLVADYHGGRQTEPTNYNPFAALPYAYIPRRGLSGIDLTEYKPNDFAPWQLLQILADNQSDLSLAIWNMVRLGCSDFTYEARTSAGGEDATGKALLDEIVHSLNPKAGGIDALSIQGMICWYLFGATCYELALTENLRDVQDIYPVAPFTIFFRRDAQQNLVMAQQQLYPQAGSPITGQGMNPAQNFPFRTLNDLLVRYTPCDPMIDDPYGRAPAAPFINEWGFDINLWVDLQKVVHGVAVPRYVIKIIEEILVKSVPSQLKNKPAEYAKWLDDRLTDVLTAFNKLPADAAFGSYDSVTLDVVGPKTGANILSLVTPLMRAIERRIIKSLKMLPILMGSNESTTETHGSVQFEIFAQGIHAAQSAISGILAHLLEVALQVRGHVSRVTCSFRDIHAGNRMTDATATNREITNEALMVSLGWKTNDDASIAVTGSPAVGPPVAGVLEGLTPSLSPTPANVESGARMLESMENRIMGRLTEVLSGRGE